MSIRVFLLCLLLLVAAGLPRAQELTFFVVGDWGGSDFAPYTTEIQLAVRNSMGVFGAQRNPAFILSLGDNMYNAGPANDSDPRFQQSFENVYTHPSLQRRWYMTVGDHDWLGNLTAQISYTQKSNKWYLPSLSYDEVFTIPGTATRVHLIVVDGWDLTWEGKNLGGPALNPAQGQATLLWLENVLKTSTATWRIVAMHYPIFSGAAKGPKNPDLVPTLAPILEKYKVDVFLAGHDHTMQHLQRNGIDYVICGMGSAAVPFWDAIPRLDADVSLKYRFPITSNLDGGFCILTVRHSTMNIEFIQDTNFVLYNYTDLPPSPPPPPSLLQDYGWIAAVVVVPLVVIAAVVIGVVLYRRRQAAAPARS